MKHGDKAKAKSAKAKASGKDASSKKDVAKSSKGAKKSSQAASKKERSSKAAAPKNDNGKGKARNGGPPGAVNFTNPAVGEAFRRAVKKYPTAFRRLTD